MSIIKEDWINKRIYRTQPKFMPQSTIRHPFDYSYCIYGRDTDRRIEDKDIMFVGFNDEGGILAKQYGFWKMIGMMGIGNYQKM